MYECVLRILLLVIPVHPRLCTACSSDRSQAAATNCNCSCSWQQAFTDRESEIIDVPRIACRVETNDSDGSHECGQVSMERGRKRERTRVRRRRERHRERANAALA